MILVKKLSYNEIVHPFYSYVTNQQLLFHFFHFEHGFTKNKNNKDSVLRKKYFLRLKMLKIPQKICHEVLSMSPDKYKLIWSHNMNYTNVSFKLPPSCSQRSWRSNHALDGEWEVPFFNSSGMRSFLRNHERTFWYEILKCKFHHGNPFSFPCEFLLGTDNERNLTNIFIMLKFINNF